MFSFLSHQTLFNVQAKLLSTEFKAITPEEREKWDKLAAEDKERYQLEMETYEPPSSDDEQVVATKKKKQTLEHIPIVFFFFPD